MRSVGAIASQAANAKDGTKINNGSRSRRRRRGGIGVTGSGGDMAKVGLAAIGLELLVASAERVQTIQRIAIRTGQPWHALGGRIYQFRFATAEFIPRNQSTKLNSFKLKIKRQAFVRPCRREY